MLLLVAVHAPLGDYMARVYSGTRHLRAERALYRLGGIDPDADQHWSVYVRSLLGFSFVSILLLYLILRVQASLPLSLGMADIPTDGAWNTAVSFVTNTNWQWYSGESAMGHLAQMGGLAVQNFLSAAVGMAVAVALVRGFARAGTDRIGNFWVDLVRGAVRILLPLAFVAAVLLIVGGAVQNFDGVREITTIDGGSQPIPGGPIASQEAIKNLGTNGGGFFNANSAHPFENPSAWTNLLEIFLLLVIPFSLPRTFGTLVGSRRQGVAIVSVMGTLWLAAVAVTTWAEMRGLGTVPHAAGGAMEGKEVRFGAAASALFAASTTGTSTGSVNSFHDSYTGLGGGVTLLNMMLGEVAPGGVGAGLYGMLVMAVLAVFLAGLMVGRTPEYLGKKIGRTRDHPGRPLHPHDADAASRRRGRHRCHARAASTPRCRTRARTASRRSSTPTPRRRTTTARRSPGSAPTRPTRTSCSVWSCSSAGSSRSCWCWLWPGRWPGSAPCRRRPAPCPPTAPVFVGLLAFVVVVVAGLTFFPALALAPLAEALL